MEETLDLLRDVGIRVPRNTDRTLIASTNGGKYQVLFARAADIPEFVELGAADVGVTGLDLLEETGCKVEKLLDLKYGHCKLVVAAPEHSGITSIAKIPSGARVATVTSRGYRDLLEIGRQNRFEMYNLKTLRAVPLSPRRWRYELDERVLWDGTVLLAPSAGQVDTLARQLHAAGVEAVAVCFLFSFLNTAHERTVAAQLRALGPWYVTMPFAPIRVVPPSA